MATTAEHGRKWREKAHELSRFRKQQKKERASQPTTPQSYPQISPQEAQSLKPEGVPYGMLLNLTTGEQISRHDLQVCYQQLETMDAPEIGFEEYRSGVVDQLLSALETSNIVCLVGPSKSGKTETILRGDSGYFPSEQTVQGKAGAYYVQGNRLGYPDLDSKIQAHFEKESSDEKIVIIDECKAEPKDIEIISELLEKGYKIIICRGGRVSNQGKVTAWRELGDANQCLKEMPIIEVSTKPLSQEQLLGFFEYAYTERVAGSLQKSRVPEKTNMITSWKKIISLFMKNKKPCTFFIARYLWDELYNLGGDIEVFTQRVSENMFFTEKNPNLEIILFEHLKYVRTALGDMVSLEEIQTTV